MASSDRRIIEVTVPGEWRARPADDPEADWKRAATTPAAVTIQSGQVYELKADTSVRDAELAGLAHLRGLTGLQSLDLSECERVTDAGLAHLAGLTGLQSLDLGGCEQGKRVTDAGLAHLRGLTGLRSLDLRGRRQQVTDAGLAHLRGLTGLQSLQVMMSEQVTHAGLRTLKAAMPTLHNHSIAEVIATISGKQSIPDGALPWTRTGVMT
jgi:hypothetical protein